MSFVIDDIKTKISARSQKKFAILTISDEEAKCEVPIWPELFEKQGHILVENDLYFAILEKDQNIKCHFIEEFSKFNKENFAEYKEIFNGIKKSLISKENKVKKIIKKENIFLHIDFRFELLLQEKNKESFN